MTGLHYSPAAGDPAGNLEAAPLRRPILINGFQGGGTNVLLNLISSHPDATWISRETQRIFQDRKFQRALGWRDRRHMRRSGFWAVQNTVRRKAPNASVIKAIYEGLERQKIASFEREPYRYRSEETEYDKAEYFDLRFVMKNVNGMTFTDRMFHDLLPGMASVYLVRNPFSLWESFARYGRVPAYEHFIALYRAVADEMVYRAQETGGMLVRFEDVLADPVARSREILQSLELDPARLGKYRLQIKPHFQAHGERNSGRTFVWTDAEHIGEHITAGVDAHQIARLPQDAMDALERDLGRHCALLGYDTALFRGIHRRSGTSG